MDGQRFDDLTRLLGTGGSRRGVLRVLVAGLLSAGGLGGRRGLARAQVCVGTDGPCAEGNECCTGLCGEGVCACRAEGETCASAAECCDDEFGRLPCTDGVCAAPTCTGEQEDCGRYGPCCAGGCTGEGSLVCIAVACTDVGDCPTNAARCEGGVCVGATCDVDYYCAPGSSCRGGRCVDPCGESGATCGESGATCGESGLPCCGELSCVEGLCVEPTACAEEDGVCATDADCCEGLPCTGGVCRLPDDETGDPDDGAPDDGAPDDGDVDGGGSAPSDPPATSTGGPTTLPATGVAGGDAASSPLPGMLLAGGAAALLASGRLRRDPHSGDSRATPEPPNRA